MKLYIYSHNPHSEGAKALAKELGVKRIKQQNSKFKGGLRKAVINWGSSKLPDQVLACQLVLNRPEAVNNASCKLRSFQLFSEKGVTIPDFTSNKDTANEWLEEGSEVVARTILRGCSGAGIELCSFDSGLVDAPLYVKYVKKTQEFRYHVFKGEVVDVQRKARKKEVADEEVNWKIRNLDGGFIFAREGVEVNEDASKNAIMAVEALGLDFGAVDIIYNKQEDKYLVLEVNTAPGLSGTTLDGYAKRLGELL